MRGTEADGRSTALSGGNTDAPSQLSAQSPLKESDRNRPLLLLLKDVNLLSKTDYSLLHFPTFS